MKTLFALILGLGLAATNLASACDCGYLADTFEKTVQLHNQRYGTQMPLTVVSGKVLKHQNFRNSYNGKFPLEMVFEVSEVTQGEIATSTIVVKGDNGMMCRPYISKFPEGTRWALALSKDTTGDSYWISSCGVYSKKLTQE